MAGSVVTGTISVSVDADEVQAVLEFAPSKDGEQWGVDRTLQLIAERRLSPSPSPKAIEELLQKWARAKEPISAVIAKGVVPEQPSAETVLWAPFEPDEEAAPLVADILATASPPELFRTRIEKVKRETVVKKPSPLPFLPPKEEIVVEWDKVEHREPARVDAAVRESGWAERGAKLGTIQPPRPGKPGKSVFGKPIPPLVLSDPAFLTGAAIIRDKSELRAAVTGVLRIGTGWADIVPLPRPRWEVKIGNDGATWTLDFEPGDGRFASPEAVEILADAAAKGADAAALIDEGSLAATLDEANRSARPLAAFFLTKRQDGAARVDVSPDKLLATLTMLKGTGGGAPLALKAVSEAIRDSKVRGFKADKVKADILEFYKGTDSSVENYVLVEGKAPTRGSDRELSVCVSCVSGEERDALTARIQKSPSLPEEAVDAAAFPPSEATDAAMVQEGTPVAVLERSAPGTAGVDVYGTALPAIPGNDPVIRLFGGLKLAKDEVLAERAGVLLIKRNEAELAGYVVPYKDSTVKVSVVPGAMEATVELSREVGPGLPLQVAAVAAALEKAGVVRGVDQKELGAAVAEAIESGSTLTRVVARGEAPVQGGGTGVKWLIQVPTGKKVVLRADGRADYKNQENFVAVKEGTPLVELVRQGDEGRPGFDVLGKILEAEKGPSEELVHDESVREEPIPGGVRLVAARGGELSLQGTALSITAVHAVAGDVSVATGNVNFPGEVRIQGKVSSGFAVIAGGDVYIGDCVEAALVSSGGSLMVSQGVLGHGKGALRARKGIDASFAENATMLAVEDVRLKNACMQCRIKTNGKLSLLGEKGHLIGGYCRARGGIDVANLGSERGARTELSFGQDYLVKDQIEATEGETEKLKAGLLELEKRIKAASAQNALDSLRQEKVRLMKLLEQRSLKLFTLRERFEEHHESEVRVRGTVFPGVVLESHGRYYEIKQRKSKVIFIFDPQLGRIQEGPLQ